MKQYKRVISLLLLISVCVLCFMACKKNSDGFYGGDAPLIKYDPYDNVLKDPVDTGSPIAVTGKTYVFDSVDVRDASADKQVTAGNSLKKLYLDSSFVFTAENKVKFVDDYNDEYYFVMPETEGVRSGNVLNVKHTNKDGVEYDIRFEIHTDKIYVIHNGHTYNKDGVYATFLFTAIK